MASGSSRVHGADVGAIVMPTGSLRPDVFCQNDGCPDELRRRQLWVIALVTARGSWIDRGRSGPRARNCNRARLHPSERLSSIAPTPPATVSADRMPTAPDCRDPRRSCGSDHGGAWQHRLDPDLSEKLGRARQVERRAHPWQLPRLPCWRDRQPRWARRKQRVGLGLGFPDTGYEDTRSPLACSPFCQSIARDGIGRACHPAGSAAVAARSFMQELSRLPLLEMRRRARNRAARQPRSYRAFRFFGIIGDGEEIITEQHLARASMQCRTFAYEIELHELDR